MAIQMTPERRAEGLAAASRTRRTELVALAEEIARRSEIEIVEAPSAATLMVELESPAGRFCFTEVVVTYATARVNGRDGWACVAGWDEEAALAAALCDAVADRQVERLAEEGMQLEVQEVRAQARVVGATALDLA